MRSRKLLVALSAGVAILLACADSTGPPIPPPFDPADQGGNRATFHMLRWDPSLPLQFTAVSGPDDVVLPSPVTVPPLDRPEVSFWATQGTATSVRINYRSTDDTWLPFLDLALNETSLVAWPDGESGDRVLITVRVDTVELRVHVGPSGLIFNPRDPALLTLWYSGADPDLNRDGRIDLLDDTIEREGLHVWTRPKPFDPWVTLDDTQSVEEKRFIVDLFGEASYSGYAVSYSGYAVSY
ncbi:MAG: hypothetical protein OEO20_12920 [Gemmatimonadota bacterium]|nr:hypothetical protein [Gemmatimonadota bacterium]MDH3369128.1 hypothetical protein [Gemmatimonadota bacterium]MDH3479197.1 hypothetical protein [Gemmatimonadota bacterium]MDH3569705.1 hypothetical protein [Gemmatimonadota bacterium]MDH5548580.1 hypothetical protein [Gemmatimonadota bacterium]